MQPQEILARTAHRSSAFPKRPWKYYQEWNDALFLHWAVEETKLREFVPSDLEIDLFSGKPWVSVVAFTMNNIRPRYLPPFPPISDFHEINIRTYVTKNNKSGVYFLSIEASKKTSSMVSRLVSRLPYRYAKMKRHDCVYQSENPGSGDRLTIHYNVGDRIRQKAAVDTWLTERYALYQEAENAMLDFDVHHDEWAVHKLHLSQVDITYPRFHQLLDNTPQITHYSPGVGVVAWSPNSTNRLTGRY